MRFDKHLKEMESDARRLFTFVMISIGTDFFGYLDTHWFWHMFKRLPPWVHYAGHRCTGLQASSRTDNNGAVNIQPPLSNQGDPPLALPKL